MKMSPIVIFCYFRRSLCFPVHSFIPCTHLENETTTTGSFIDNIKSGGVLCILFFMQLEHILFLSVSMILSCYVSLKNVYDFWENHHDM